MLVAFERRGSPRTGWYHQPIVSVVGDLDRHRYISLSTFRRNGAEVATPVWFAADGAKLYVFTLGDSGKVKRLRQTAQARVAPSDSRGRVQGAARAATARLISEPAVIDRAHRALRAKYGWQMRVADLFSGLTGRARRRAYIEIDVE
jgi:PPOX class probable F420-dependent enzyme